MREIDSFPREVREVEHFWIPMPDGVRLSARMWLPADAEERPVPAVLEYIPYRKRDFTASRDARNHPYLAGYGYACVRVDLRGSGESDGLLTDEYLETELDDGVEVLRWIAAQPWCDGNVGMMGISWGGFNALQVASRKPPELKAVVTVCSTDDRYADDVHYMGGCLLGDNLSWASTMFARNTVPPDPELYGEGWRDAWLARLEGSGLWLDTWLRHQHRDDYWKHGSICEDFSAIQCPVLAASGWADGYSNAVFRLLEHLHVPRRGLIGPWSHKYPHLGVPGPAIGFLQEVLRWWDQWLKGIDTGVADEPMLTVWMQDSVPPTTRYAQRPGRWVAEPSWPSTRVVERSYPLAARRIADPAEHVPERRIRIQSPLSVGLFAGKWCSYSATPDLPHDQREEDGGALVFDTERLDAPLEILGAPYVDLDLSASQPVAMVAVRLSDVHEDDKATRVTYGILNLTHRESSEQPEPLEPGRRYRVRVMLNGVAHSFPSGHRLRVAISTSYWPLAWPPPRPVRLEIQAGSSELVLPERPPRAEDERLSAFPEPEAAPPLRRTTLDPPRYLWMVERDLEHDRSTLHVVKDEGRFRLDDIDLEIRDCSEEWYSYERDDFTTPRGETHWRVGLARGDWRVATDTHTVLTCDAERFWLHADLDAFEDGRRVFCRSWDRTIPRDLL